MCGFTLSEVLVTLMIIGVVAVLTIPTIMNSIWNMQQKNQFKKAYTTVYQALYEIKNNVGYVPNCFYNSTVQSAPQSGECASLFFPEFKKNLNIIKDCPDHAYSGGCIPYYNDNAGGGCPGFSQTNMQNNNPTYVLADGTIIAPYGVAGALPLIVVDINGQKPPNKWGYDVFDLFWYGNNDALKVQPSTCFTPDTGGITTDVMIQNAFK